MTTRQYVTLTTLGCGLLLFAPQASAQFPDGSWFRSCPKNRAISGTVLTATCITMSGGELTTSLDISNCTSPVYVNNDDGYLVCEGGAPKGSYRLSCQPATMNNGTLTASCSDGAGHYTTSSLEYWHCWTPPNNILGRLSCDMGIGYSPEASYRATCVRTERSAA